MIQFTVPGEAVPQGSKKAFFVKALGRAAMTESSAKLKPWRSLVSLKAQDTMNGQPPLDCPVMVLAVFEFPRPRGHFGTGKNETILKASAPSWKTSKPDVDKLLRGILDALTGICFRDDSVVVEVRATKKYGISGKTEISVYKI